MLKMRGQETVSLKPRHLWRGETVSRIFIIWILLGSFSLPHEILPGETVQ
jgi:hypothetical protein